MDTQREMDRRTLQAMRFGYRDNEGNFVAPLFGFATLRAEWKVVPVAEAPGRQEARRLPWWFRLLVWLGVVRKVR